LTGGVLKAIRSAFDRREGKGKKGGKGQSSSLPLRFRKGGERGDGGDTPTPVFDEEEEDLEAYQFDAVGGRKKGKKEKKLFPIFFPPEGKKKKKVKGMLKRNSSQVSGPD